MPLYSVFGTSLCTALELPELMPLASPSLPLWTLNPVESSQIPTDGEVLGSVPYSRCCATLRKRSEREYVFSHTCTGHFHLEGSANAIHYATRDDAPPDLVRGDILGRVLAVALHSQGSLSLHASAVALHDGVVAFVAPKGFGKSTLSLALAIAGASFVTDDLLPVDAGALVTAARGVQSVRLRADSAAQLVDDAVEWRPGIDGKRIVDQIPGARLSSVRAPLSAVYLLAPTVVSLGSMAARRIAVPRRRAAIELVRHAKLGALLGGTEAAATFDLASRIANTVPVFTLELARDLDRLHEVVTEVSGWHGGIPAHAA